MVKTKHLVLVLGFAALTAACGSSSSSTPDASGAAGTTGDAGTSGAAGDTGSAGTTGAAGTTGGAGTTGAAGTTGGAGTGAAGTGAAACNTIGHTGPEAPEVAGQGTYPTPAGGTIAEGTYDLKEFQIWPPGSVDPYKRQETWKFVAGKFEVDSKNGEGKVTIASGTYSTAGAELTIVATCPGSMTLKVPYTATATSLWTFDTNEIHVYTKRQ
jgi:hypothetical protein